MLDKLYKIQVIETVQNVELEDDFPYKWEKFFVSKIPYVKIQELIDNFVQLIYKENCQTITLMAKEYIDEPYDLELKLSSPRLSFKIEDFLLNLPSSDAFYFFNELYFSAIYTHEEYLVLGTNLRIYNLLEECFNEQGNIFLKINDVYSEKEIEENSKEIEKSVLDLLDSERKTSDN